MRIFLSYTSADWPIAEALKKAIEANDKDARIFYAPMSLRAGRFWMPQLGSSVAEADAFLLLLGEKLGPYQMIEYYEAFDRHAKNPSFALVPVLTAKIAPNLPFIRQLHWIEALAPTAEPALSKIIGALKGLETDRSAELWRTVNPYRGLESLREEDADFFFGREAETSAVLTALLDRENRAVTLIGNSGTGKSSLVEAGVFAALKRRQWLGGYPWPEALAESRQWAFLTMRPGEDPVRSLLAAFMELWFVDALDADRVARRHQWTELLREGRAHLSDLIDATQARFERELNLIAPKRVVLNINQSEELYTLTPEHLRAPFSKLIAEGLRDPRLAVVATLRSDHYGHLQENRVLFDVSTRIDVPPLDSEALKTVLEGPAKMLGARFEPDALAEFIVNGAAGQAGALPLLAFYMTDLWSRMQKRGDGVIRLSDHTEIVDVAKALAVQADRFLSSHNSEADAVKRLFTLKLARVQDEGKPVRRRAYRNKLDVAEIVLVDKLADPAWRLVVTGTEEGGAAFAEVAHEVLLDRWGTLVKWLEEEREFLVFKSRCERARFRHEEAGKPKTALLSGLDLIQAEQWLANRPRDFDADDLQFVRESIRVRDADFAAAERTKRLFTQFAAAAAAVLAVVAGLAVWKWTAAARETAEAQRQEKRADTQVQETYLAQARFLTGRARQILDAGDPVPALLLGLAGLPDSHAGSDRPALPDLERVTLEALQTVRETALLTGHGNRVSVGFFAPDGASAVTASWDNTARIWDVQTGKVRLELKGHQNTVSSGAFSPSGALLVTSSWDKTARIWDARTGDVKAVLAGHAEAVNSAVFSPDGTKIVTASDDRTAIVWDAKSGAAAATLKGSGSAVNAAVFSPGGETIVTTSDDNTALLWNAQTGERMAELAGHAAPVVSAAFSPDGSLVATASWDGTARLWNAKTGAPVGVLEGHTREVVSVAFSPDGERLVTASWDKRARLWNVKAYTGAETRHGGGEPAGGAAGAMEADREGSKPAEAPGASRESGAAAQEGDIVPDGTPMQEDAASPSEASSSGEGTNDGDAAHPPANGGRTSAGEGEDPDDPGESVAVLKGHDGALNGAVFSTDGTRIVTASQDKTAKLWDGFSGALIATLGAHNGLVESATFSPDGTRAITASWDGTARLWDAKAGVSLAALEDGLDGDGERVLSRDGLRAIVLLGAETVQVSDAKTGAPLVELKGHKGEVTSAAFIADGLRAVTGSRDGTARIWDLSTGKSIMTFGGPPGEVLAVAVSPDGTKVMTGNSENAAQLWDAASGAVLPIQPPKHAGPVLSVAFSPDGSRAVTASEDRTAVLWDVATGTALAVFKGHQAAVKSAVFSADGGEIATKSEDGTTRHWRVYKTTDELVQAAKIAAPRCLSPPERSALFIDPRPQIWCITGPGLEENREAAKWQPRAPYDTAEWKGWLKDWLDGRKPLLPAANVGIETKGENR